MKRKLATQGLSVLPEAGVITGLMQIPMFVNQALRIVYDFQLVDEKEGIYSLYTSAINETVARQKIRLFVALLRPHRKIVDWTTEVVEQGVMLKKYHITIKTTLLMENRQQLLQRRNMNQETQQESE